MTEGGRTGEPRGASAPVALSSAPESGQGPVPDVGTTISITDVSKSFVHKRGRFYALRNLDLMVSAGEFVSLIGPSGCGKSTLLRLVGGLMEPDEGEISIGGQTPQAARARKAFGLVPQEHALLPWRTVLGNVKLLGELNRKSGGTVHSPSDAVELLEAVGLGDFLHSLPKELSGGMRQRVSLVRAFSLGAPLLLMDEPFASVDEFTRESLRFQLLELWQRTNKTVIFVTHNIEEAIVLSDRVTIMSPRPGRIVADQRVDLPRPREHGIEDTEEFRAHMSDVKAVLRRSWAR